MSELPKSKKYTDAEMRGIFESVMDPSKIILSCGQHRYIASEAPPESHGCKLCWQAWWMHKIATTPPHLRQQRLEEAYRAVYDAVKAFERGEFDFEPYERAGITITKDAEPD